jgi:predicted DNA-binding transcriptional regulator AlpA
MDDSKPKRTRRVRTPEELAEAAGLDGQQLIGPAELAHKLDLTPKTVKVNVTRSPLSLPPRFPIPGSQRLAWRLKDVNAWMDRIAAEAQRARQAAEVRAAANAMRELRFPNARRRAA